MLQFRPHRITLQLSPPGLPFGSLGAGAPQGPEQMLKPFAPVPFCPVFVPWQGVEHKSNP